MFLTVTAYVFQPGLGAAVAAISFLGWSRENALRLGYLSILKQVGIELENAGKLNDRLMARLDSVHIDMEHTDDNDEKAVLH